MHPDIRLNYLAIGASVVASFVTGFLWYGPIFGKMWAKLVNMPADFKPTSAQMARGMILMVVGAFLMSYVLAHSTEVWRASSWKAGADGPAWTYGFFAGLFTWVGFYIPPLLSSVAWEMRSWKLFAINAGYYFLQLQIVGAILAHWR